VNWSALPFATGSSIDAVTITPASDHSLLVTIAEEISPEAQIGVWRLSASLHHPAIRNLHPGYGTVLVSFDPLQIGHAEVEQLIRSAGTATAGPAQRIIKVPVCYGGEFGPDLRDVASLTGITEDEVVAAHSGAEYLTYFLGFSPGFPYLGGMPERIAAPRLDRPRTLVPAGSVAIGGKQTGIYPVASPGGWRIIGRTPIRLFRPESPHPTLLSMGDRVRFVPVPAEEFDQYRDSG
jgi:inhibitor of KinA